ncbi:DNA-binding protein [Streptacidiphilus sp. N1-3]|uniref:DNA-binding protein n=1 Tax=Streptacidiphilus alkalitolerans TaxID=3342712 RepID=A0ABV6XCA7_9ACTN
MSAGAGAGAGAVVLDSEALSLLLRDDRAMTARIEAARIHRVPVVACAMTLIEADDHRVHPARIGWVLSRLQVVAVDEGAAGLASSLLREAGLHGHKYAIDAAVAATARTLPGPVVVLTSDPEDLALLCGPGVRIVKV